MTGSITVPYVDLSLKAGDPLALQLLNAATDVITTGQYILGEHVERFEREFARIAGTKHAIGVANGTEALMLALRALRIGAGDEVITVANSFLATVSAIQLVGAKPVFVDVREDGNLDPALLKQAVTANTKAILPVHLTGKPADIDPIVEIADLCGVTVIEDAAQAVGAHYKGRPAGSLGSLGCFSLHPLKNLAAAGDGGVITTDDDTLAEWLRKGRNHGLLDRNTCAFWSLNSRLDAIQAAILNVRLPYLKGWTESRRANAAYYREHLADVVTTPVDGPDQWSVYHTFVIQSDQRDELQRFLTDRNIGTAVHYPIPIHLQPAARHLGYGPGSLPVTEHLSGRILSLPVYPSLSERQRSHVVQSVRDFYKNSKGTKNLET